MIDWIKKWVIRKWLKGALDKLPFNYKKTIIGVAILLLGAAMMLCGTFYPAECGPGTSIGGLLAMLLGWLKDMDAETLTTAGGVIAGIGLTHKFAKYVDEAENSKE